MGKMTITVNDRILEVQARDIIRALGHATEALRDRITSRIEGETIYSAEDRNTSAIIDIKVLDALAVAFGAPIVDWDFSRAGSEPDDKEPR